MKRIIKFAGLIIFVVVSFTTCDTGTSGGKGTGTGGGEIDYSRVYGVYVPDNNYNSFGNVSITETAITIRGTSYNIEFSDFTPFKIGNDSHYILYIRYENKKVGAVIAIAEPDTPELFLGMTADAQVAWLWMNAYSSSSIPGYNVEDDLGTFAGEKQ
jgi:hypothetical protein